MTVLYQRLLRLALSALVLLVAIPTIGADAKPARILSSNLCTDQLVLELADRDRIVSASNLITDPEFFPDGVDGIPPNLGEVEEIISFDPDLVITGQSMSALTERFLTELGYPVVMVPMAMSITEVHSVVRLAAAALGEQQRGEEAILNMERRLAAVTAAPGGVRPVAVVLGPNGYTSGRGTLINELMTIAGWENLAVKFGIEGWGVLDIEQVLLGSPDAVIFDQYGAGQASLAQEILEHPALSRLVAEGRILSVPVKYWLCGNTLIADAAEILAAGAQRARSEKSND